jgi:hypothetical protein
MAVSAVASTQSKLAQSLVAARSAKGPFASALASATNAISPSGSTDASQTVSQQSYDKSLGTVQAKLNQWFQTAGVDTSQDIQLSLAPDGTVQLANDHPDSAQIQQVLKNHPELGGMLQSLSSAYKQLNQPDSTASAASTSPTSQFVLTLSGGSATALMTS